MPAKKRDFDKDVEHVDGGLKAGSKPKKKTAKKKVAKKKDSMSIKEIKALVELAKSQGIKKLKVEGLELEFADVAMDATTEIEDFLDNENTVEKGIQEAVSVQDLMNREVEDDRAVTIEEDDLYSV